MDYSSQANTLLTVCVQSLCSITERQIKKNPLKRKSMDVSHKEPKLQPEERPRKRRRRKKDNDVNREMSQNNAEASCSFSRSESKEKPLKRKSIDVHHEERPGKRRRTETDNNVSKEMSVTSSEASCSFTRRESKENPFKRKWMDVSSEEPELQPDERPRKRRRTETHKDVNRKMSQNNSEAPCYFTRSKSQNNPVKRKSMDVHHEEPELQPDERQRKRRRTETDNNVNREMSENNSETSCSFPRGESKKKPLKRKSMDVHHEEPELQPEERPIKSRRTETDNDVNKEMCATSSEASCSFTRRESKENPLKRKSMDVHHEEPKLQPEDRPSKRRRTKEKGTQPVKRINPFRMEKFLGRYIVGDYLGSGGFATVHAGVRKTDGKKVACKFANKSEYDEFITLPGDTLRLPLEVALMKLVSKPPQCPYVIELLEWYETNTSFILILERPHPCTELYKFCRRLHSHMSETLAQNIMKQVVRAALHCRDRGVLHRDIKEENLLLNPRTLEVKLVDFGSGDLLRDTHYTEYTGTPIYVPPEWISDGQYNAEPATVWGLGVLLYSLLCRDEPFDDFEDTVQKALSYPDHLSEASSSLISWCLDRNPQGRPSLEQILEHHWFSGSK